MARLVGLVRPRRLSAAHWGQLSQTLALGVAMFYFQGNMRLSATLLLNLWIASVCAGQNPAAPPIPADPYELVTGKSASAKPADRTRALALLNKAKRPMRLLAPTTPPYFLTISFTAMGDAVNSGPGEFTELWLGSQNWRWTAKFGDFYGSRVHAREGTFDEKRVPLVPMRVHMLRNAVFWAA